MFYTMADRINVDPEAVFDRMRRDKTVRFGAFLSGSGDHEDPIDHGTCNQAWLLGQRYRESYAPGLMMGHSAA